MKQKRQSGAGGMVQASNISSTQLTSHSTKWMNPNKELRGKFNELRKLIIMKYIIFVFFKDMMGHYSLIYHKQTQI